MMNSATAITPTRAASLLNFMMTLLPHPRIKPPSLWFRNPSQHHALCQVLTLEGFSAVTGVTFRGEIRPAPRCFAAHPAMRNATQEQQPVVATRLVALILSTGEKATGQQSALETHYVASRHKKVCTGQVCAIGEACGLQPHEYWAKRTTALAAVVSGECIRTGWL